VKLKTLKAQWAVEFIDLPAAAHNDDAVWEVFQINYLNNTSRFSIDVKSRQIAWSFTSALDAYADSFITPGWPYTFVSINMDEATEKIRYIKAIHEATDAPVRRKIVRDSATQIELDDGTRFISHPCRPPRGKAGMRVYLDEYAHYRDGLDREVYKGALPAGIKGNGYVRIGSSTFGSRGMFYDIATQKTRKWPGFDSHRSFIPWWCVKALCNDTKTAKLVAPMMNTEERVYQFGTVALKELFENMFLEDFQQEFECAFLDEVSSWITWETIERNQVDDLLYFKATNVDDALALIPKISESIVSGKIEPVFVGGIDVGRKHDKTEMIVLGRGLLNQLPVRMMVTLNKVKYDDQEECFRQILTRLPFTQCLIDQNGIGSQLAENLTRTGKAQGVTFTNATKELWAVQARVEAERNRTPIPPDRDLKYQIHSIKKYVTAAKNVVYDTERNNEHHADKFWAWALAIYAGSAGYEQASSGEGSHPLGEEW